MDRRAFLLTLPAALPLADSANSQKKYVAHIGEHEYDLDELAVELADMECRAIRDERPLTWRVARYTGSIRFGEGTRPHYGYRKPDAFDATVEQLGARVLTSGWSKCGRCWTVFAGTTA